MRGVGHAVGVAVGILLGVVVAVGDGVAVDVDVGDVRLVAVLATVASDSGVFGGRVAVDAAVTVFVLSGTVGVDEGTVVGFNDAEVNTVETQADSIHDRMIITADESFFTKLVYGGTVNMCSNSFGNSGLQGKHKLRCHDQRGKILFWWRVTQILNKDGIAQPILDDRRCGQPRL